MSKICLRAAYLHRGNALRALGREAEARESYLKVLPILETEPRCDRLDWERMSTHINVGNTYCAEGDFDRAFEAYEKAYQLGQDHIDSDDGNKLDGMGIKIAAMRAISFAMKKAGNEQEAKSKMREVIELQMKLNVEKEWRAKEESK